MKSFSLIVLVLLFVSCTGTKKAIENSSNPFLTANKKDSLVLTDREVIKINDSLYVPHSKEKIKTLGDTLVVTKKDNTFSHNSLDTLLKKYVSEDGNVNYKDLKLEWLNLTNYISELSDNLPTEDWAKNEKLAYWINAYNAMTIDLILRHYPIKSIKDIKNPWKQRFWKLGEKWYNLNEIEHKILREMDEPRIHFAIVCASFSCPKLQNKAFNANDLDAQLTQSTKDFLNDSDRNSISENNLELSKIFQWFGKDFKQNGSLIDFINQYSEIKISENANVSFKTYNWDLNE